MAGLSLSSALSSTTSLWSGFSGLWSGASGLQAGGGGGISPQAEAYFAAMTVEPDEARKELLNNLINSLLAGGVWAKLGWLCIHASHDAQAGRINAVTPSEVATAVNSPTFTTDRGFTGDGATSYLDSGASLGASGLMSLTNAHMGVWVGTDFSNSNMGDLGITNRLSVNSYFNSAGTPTTRLVSMSTSLNAVTLPAATSVGHTLQSRSVSATFEPYKDGVALGTTTRTATNYTFAPSVYICATNAATGDVPSQFSTRRIQATHWGANLTVGEAATLYTALNTYMTAIGAV